MSLFRHFILLFIFYQASAAYGGAIFAGPQSATPNASYKTVHSATDTIVIRFDYKQSALFHPYTLETLDSIIDILLRDTAIRLSIDGYAFKDEGSDSICYYLSLNRAMFIQTYVLGRGIEAARISSINAWGKTKQKYVNKDKNGLWVNCRAELRLVYPPPPKKAELSDRDEDGVYDGEDKCPDVFGLKEKEGCPNKNAVVVPFAVQESDLQRMTYAVLDSVVSVLKDNPSYNVYIDGHAFVAEGASYVCESLATERAEIVKRYLLSRQIHASRILHVKNYGTSRPVNPGRNPLEVIKNARAEIVFTNKE